MPRDKPHAVALQMRIRMGQRVQRVGLLQNALDIHCTTLFKTAMLKNDQVGAVIAAARRRLQDLQRPPDDPLEKQLAYFENHQDKMRHKTYLMRHPDYVDFFTLPSTSRRFPGRGKPGKLLASQGGAGGRQNAVEQKIVVPFWSRAATYR